VFTELLEINRLVLEVLELPGLKMLTQFRLREASLAVAENENNAQRSGWVLDFILRRVRLRVIRVLLVEWLLLVGETSIKIYTENQANKDIEPETLLEEMAQLQEEEFLCRMRFVTSLRHREKIYYFRSSLCCGSK
jgi:hypothetical protein